MMGNFQYFRLYICPPPGITMAIHMARLISGCQELQSRLDFFFSFLSNLAIAAESSAMISSGIKLPMPLSTESLIALRLSPATVDFVFTVSCGTTVMAATFVTAKSNKVHAAIPIFMICPTLFTSQPSVFTYRSYQLLFQLVEHVHNMLQLILVVKRNTNLSLALCRTRQFHLGIQEVG